MNHEEAIKYLDKYFATAEFNDNFVRILIPSFCDMRNIDFITAVERTKLLVESDGSYLRHKE